MIEEDEGKKGRQDRWRLARGVKRDGYERNVDSRRSK